MGGDRWETIGDMVNVLSEIVMKSYLPAGRLQDCHVHPALIKKAREILESAQQRACPKCGRKRLKNQRLRCPSGTCLPKDQTNLSVTNQEHATILAALRYYQENGQGEPHNRSDAIHDIATNGGAVVSMDADGIDDLCQKINCGE